MPESDLHVAALIARPSTVDARWGIGIDLFLRLERVNSSIDLLATQVAWSA
jgi:hypothetical protein